MKFFRHVRLLLLLLAVHATVAHAQQPAEAGIVVSYRFGVPLELLRSVGHVNGLAAGGIGSSYTNIVGGGLHAAFGSLLSERFGLDMSGEVLVAAGRFRSAVYAGDRELDPLTGQIVPAQYQSLISSTRTALDAQLRICYSLATNSRLSAGIWGTPQLSATYNYAIRKLAPLVPNSTVPDSVPPAFVTTEPSAALRYGLGAAGSMELPVGTGLLRPELGARLDLPALADGLGIRSLSVRASLAWVFLRRQSVDSVSPPPQPPVIARGADDISVRRSAVPFNATDPAVGPESRDLTAKPRLVASIDLFSPGEGGIRLQTAQVHPEIIQHQIWMAFPTLLYCDAGITGIPERYRQFTPEHAASFAPAELVHRSPADIYCHALDLLGYRMRLDQSTTVTLVGNRSVDERPGIAQARADAARAYLHDVWGIASERIATKRGLGYGMGDDHVERCVVIEGPVESLLAPVVVEWRSRAYRLPPLDIDPEIEAQAGVRNWTITVRQDGHVVTSYSSSDNEDGNTDIHLAIPEDYAGGVLPPLVAEMAVEDSSGQKCAVHDTLPLVIGAGNDSAVSTDRANRLYVVPDGSERRAKLREIAAGVHDGESITVRGIEAAEIASTLRTIVDARRRNVVWTVDVSDGGIGGLPTAEEHHVNECGLVELAAVHEGDSDGR
ncbi:MAG: hypothetical protein JST22_17095 [Bacteroidetes bacterium]|nr:hypothetical protein [Bacteroidota bacterium]